MSAAIINIYVDDAKALSSPVSVVEPCKRPLYIQVTPAVAILIVIATHCRDPFVDSAIIRSETAGVIFSHIDMFFFISGFLLQFLFDAFRYRRYLTSKVRNVIILM